MKTKIFNYFNLRFVQNGVALGSQKFVVAEVRDHKLQSNDAEVKAVAIALPWKRATESTSQRGNMKKNGLSFGHNAQQRNHKKNVLPVSSVKFYIDGHHVCVIPNFKAYIFQSEQLLKN